MSAMLTWLACLYLGQSFITIDAIDAATHTLLEAVNKLKSEGVINLGTVSVYMALARSN